MEKKRKFADWKSILSFKKKKKRKRNPGGNYLGLEKEGSELNEAEPFELHYKSSLCILFFFIHRATSEGGPSVYACLCVCVRMKEAAAAAAEEEEEEEEDIKMGTRKPLRIIRR